MMWRTVLRLDSDAEQQPVSMLASASSKVTGHTPQGNGPLGDQACWESPEVQVPASDSPPKFTYIIDIHAHGTQRHQNLSCLQLVHCGG